MSERITPITMPKWGMAMEEGTVVVWHVEEGQSVAAGQEVVDVESPKIANALEAKRDGVLRRQVAELGSVLPVGGLIGIIADSDVPDPEIDDFVSQYEVPASSGGEAAGPSLAYANTDDGAIAYLEMGEGDPPILLIHGFGGDQSSFMFNQSALAEQRRVVAVDVPGHGASFKRIRDGSAEALAKQIGAAIDALGLDRVHLVGHSLGGAIALALASDRPDLPASLTLIAGAGLGEEINGEFVDAFIAAERRRDMTGVARMLYADEKLVTRRAVEDMLRIKRIDGVAEAMAAIAAQQFESGRQRILDVPDASLATLVIWGEADRVIPVAHAARIDHARRHVVKGAGHMVHAEAPGEVNRVVAEFCDAHA